MHRNTINFVGMCEREKYLGTKVMQDKFVALSKSNQLSTWDVVTGRLDASKEYNIKKENG